MTEENSVRKLVDNYYEARGLKEPDEVEALLWLISEIGELTEAVTTPLAEKGAFEGDDHSRILGDFFNTIRAIGLKADDLVMHKSGWIRNHAKPNTIKDSIHGEAADVLMMLDRVALETGCEDVFDCMIDKIRSKGFVVYGDCRVEKKVD